MPVKTIALLIFIACYMLFIFLPKKRTFIAVLGAALLIVLQSISLKQAFYAINWNVMGIFVGFLQLFKRAFEGRFNQIDLWAGFSSSLCLC